MQVRLWRGVIRETSACCARRRSLIAEYNHDAFVYPGMRSRTLSRD